MFSFFNKKQSFCYQVFIKIVFIYFFIAPLLLLLNKQVIGEDISINNIKNPTCNEDITICKKLLSEAKYDLVIENITLTPTSIDLSIILTEAFIAKGDLGQLRNFISSNKEKIDLKYYSNLKNLMEKFSYTKNFLDFMKEGLLLEDPFSRLISVASEYRNRSWYLEEAYAINLAKSIKSDYPGLNALLGIAYFHDAQYGEARKSFQQALKENPSDKSLWIFQGDTLYAMHLYPESEKIFQYILSKYPDEPDAIAGMARIYHTIGKTNDAMKLLNSATQRFKKNEKIWLTFAQISMEMKQWPTAQRSLETLLEINPKSYLGHLLIGKLFVSQGRLSRVEFHLKEALSIRPKNTEAYLQLAEFYQKSNQLSLAVKAIETAYSLNKNYFPIILKSVQLYEQTGNIEKKILFYKILVEEDPIEISWRWKLCIALCSLGNCDEAKEHIDYLKSNKSDDGRINFLMAEVAFRKNDIQKAQDEIKIARQKMGEHTDVYRLIGDIWFLKDDMSKAYQSYNKSLSLDFTNTEAHFGLGRVYFKTGKTYLSIKEWNLVINLRPESQEAIQAKLLLNSINNQSEEKAESNLEGLPEKLINENAINEPFIKQVK